MRERKDPSACLPDKMDDKVKLQEVDGDRTVDDR